MRRQVTRDMIQRQVRALERNLGIASFGLVLEKAPGRGGWWIRTASGMVLDERRREARDMLATLAFTNRMLRLKEGRL